LECGVYIPLLIFRNSGFFLCYSVLLLFYFDMAEKVNGIHPPAEVKVNGHSSIDSEDARRTAYIK